jgi:hypothetical protein
MDSMIHFDLNQPIDVRVQGQAVSLTRSRAFKVALLYKRVEVVE